MRRSEIAGRIGVHRSTVYREIKRNSNVRLVGYKAYPAIAAARERHRRKRKRGIAGEIWAMVEELLELDWSPEQISKRLSLEGLPSVSHETIYLRLYRDKLKGGLLYLHLRRRRYGYRKRIHKYSKRGAWDTRRPIRERPPIVDERSRLGDWEADTIIGRGRKGAILSLVERRSRLVLLEKLANMSPGSVADAFSKQLSPLKEKVLTITSDNGFEFLCHKDVAERLDAGFFFADPYSAWQRGTVENTNGLVRQYFPKKTDFTTLTESDLKLVTLRLNNRPRKSLGFRTPNEVFQNQSVALIT